MILVIDIKVEVASDISERFALFYRRNYFIQFNYELIKSLAKFQDN